MNLLRTRRAGGERRVGALDAAIDVVAERGWENTRFADVSAVCQIAVSTLQCYFGSREDMLVETLRRAIELQVVAIEQTAEAERDPWRRIVALVTRSLNTSDRDRRIMLEFWRATIRDDDLREYCEELQDRCRRPYLRAIAQGCAENIFTIKDDPEDIVDVMAAAFCGLSHPWAAQHSRQPLDGFRAVWLGQLASTLGVSPERLRECLVT